MCNLTTRFDIEDRLSGIFASFNDPCARCICGDAVHTWDPGYYFRKWVWVEYSRWILVLDYSTFISSFNLWGLLPVGVTSMLFGWRDVRCSPLSSARTRQIRRLGDRCLDGFVSLKPISMWVGHIASQWKLCLEPWDNIVWVALAKYDSELGIFGPSNSKLFHDN